MEFPLAMMQDTVWVNRLNYIQAEEHYQLSLVSNTIGTTPVKSPEPKSPEPKSVETKSPEPKCEKANPVTSPLISEITTMRENIKSSLSGMTTNTNVTRLEEENKATKILFENLSKQVADLTLRVDKLEGSVAPEKPTSLPLAKKEEAADEDDDDDDDDFDLFGDDADDEEEEETEEEKKKREQLLQKYNEKKAKKPVLIAKSNIILDVKPWDDETDMKQMERLVRTIKMDGLLWGNSKLVPVGYGIHKLQISCVVEDEKVGSDILSEEITKFEDFVQSVDVAAFNKI